MIDLTPLQKLPMNVGVLDKLIVAKGFKNLPNLVTLHRCNDFLNIMLMKRVELTFRQRKTSKKRKR